MKVFTNRFVNVTAGVGLAMLLGGAWVSARAQGLGPSSAGSLAELTAEVRQLRLVVQDAGRNQTQIWRLGYWRRTAPPGKSGSHKGQKIV